MERPPSASSRWTCPRCQGGGGHGIYRGPPIARLLKQSPATIRRRTPSNVFSVLFTDNGLPDGEAVSYRIRGEVRFGRHFKISVTLVSLPLRLMIKKHQLSAQGFNRVMSVSVCLVIAQRTGRAQRFSSLVETFRYVWGCTLLSANTACVCSSRQVLKSIDNFNEIDNF